MKKQLLTAFMLFLPVLQNFISAQPLHVALMDIKFEVTVILSIIFLFLIVRIASVIYFWVSIINWISSGFKIVKLIPCVICFIAIFCIDYSIEAIVDAIIKSIKYKLQRIPDASIETKKQTLQVLACRKQVTLVYCIHLFDKYDSQ